MGTIVASENVSLDGVVEDPAGDEGFTRGGWVGQITGSDEVGRVKLDEALRAEALLLGRRSYEFFAARWPHRSGALADRLNSLPKYVVSSTLKDPAWNNTTVLNGDLVEAVAALRQRANGEILVYASFRLLDTLMEHDLVDEVRMTVYPVVLGDGARIFGRTSNPKPMSLITNRTVADGIVVLTYEPVRQAHSSKSVRI